VSDYLIRYNKADQVKRWIVEDPMMGRLIPVVSIELKNCSGSTHIDDLQCLHSIKVQGTLVIENDRAIIMGDEPKN
jgi:hypothetical protein